MTDTYRSVLLKIYSHFLNIIAIPIKHLYNTGQVIIVKRKDILSVIILTIVSCFSLYIIEQVIQATYVIKTGAKVVFFFILPIIYIRFILKEKILDFLNIKTIDMRRLQVGFLFGLASALIIVVTFIIAKDFINTDKIITDLNDRLHITPEVYIFIALYITFGNSLLEEFYFRGFIFLKFYQANYKTLGYLFSALLFAIYHVAIFATWFNIWLILLALLGLFIVGIIFNWLNTKSNNFLNSWILHIMADIAVVSIGYYLFQTTLTN